MNANITNDNYLFNILCILVIYLIVINIQYLFNRDDIQNNTHYQKKIIQEGFSIGSLWSKVKTLGTTMKSLASLMKKLILLPVKMIKLMVKMIKLIKYMKKFFDIMQNLPKYIYKLTKNIATTIISNMNKDLVGKLKGGIFNPINMLFSSFFMFFSGIKNVIISSLTNAFNMPKCIILNSLNQINSSVKPCKQRKEEKMNNVIAKSSNAFSLFYKNFGNI
jgi:hypothetical protein